MAQPDTLPTDLESAHALIKTLCRELSGRDLLIEKLKHQLFGERRHRYGSSSEALDQLQLMLEDLELERSADAPAEDIQVELKQKPVRKPLPEHLPRNDAVLSPPDACTSCGGKLKQVSQDVTEELDFIPGRFVVNRIVRPRMAHIRRKFVDIVKANGSATATEAVQRIAELYAIEKQIRGRPPDERAQVRQDRAKPLLNDLDAWLKSELTKVSGKSTLGKAIHYALTRMPKVRPYLKHGFLELDNNFAERSIRGIALGRKNYLFMGSEGGGKAAAIAYTLIETCKLNSIDPQAWLTDTLARIADHKITHLDELMPWNDAASAA